MRLGLCALGKHPRKGHISSKSACMVGSARRKISQARQRLVRRLTASSWRYQWAHQLKVVARPARSRSPWDWYARCSATNAATLT